MVTVVPRTPYEGVNTPEKYGASLRIRKSTHQLSAVSAYGFVTVTCRFGDPYGLAPLRLNLTVRVLPLELTTVLVPTMSEPGVVTGSTSFTTAPVLKFHPVIRMVGVIQPRLPSDGNMNNMVAFVPGTYTII